MRPLRHTDAIRTSWSSGRESLIVWVLICVSPLVAVLIALGTGRVSLTPLQIVSALWAPDANLYDSAIVWHARLPRTLTSLLVGAGLGASGAALQGLFRNPLAGPQTVGVLSGAGFGGSLAIFMGLGSTYIIAGAFAAGLLAVFAVIAFARLAGGLSVLMIVLAGILVSSLAAAGTTLMQYAADPEEQLPELVYWLMGSFAGTTLSEVFGLITAVSIGVVILWGYALRIDLMSSGEDEARAFGLNLRRDRFIVLAAVALTCAAGVAVSGVIGWVGLVVPHAARFLVGPGHRRLILASALIGAAFLCLIDTAARSLTAAELPVSALTALIGAPVFLALLAGLRRSGGHDA